MAEIPFVASGKKGLKVPLIVRRVRPTPETQLAPFTEFSDHPLVNDREGFDR